MGMRDQRLVRATAWFVVALAAVASRACSSWSAAPGASADAGADASEAAAPGDGGTGVTDRVDLDFDLDWKYQKGNVVGAEASAYDDGAWSYVDLPHSTEFVTPEAPNAYLGLSWYRKHFSVDSAYLDSKVFVEFEAAMQLADVWINGVHQLQHQGGYAPFTVDITNALHYDGTDNVIAVKLDSNGNSSFAPGWNGVDFQYHGGLYRNVKLHVTNRVHVSDAVYANKAAGGGVFVTYPALDSAQATVAVATNVINDSALDRSVTLLSEVVDDAGSVVGTSSNTSNVPAGTDFDFSQQITVTEPKLWHPNSPSLYTLRSTVQDGGVTVDHYSTRIGLRRIEWTRARGLSINGSPFLALGVNLHQETYGLGNAVPDPAIYYEVKRIKEGGSSFIRGSHYPHAPAFYDACDALGVVVLDAQTGWQQYNATSAFDAATFQELRDMIRRDRNHPSVVAWEASLNESNYTDAWADTAHGIVHQEYPGDQAYSAQWILGHSDIAIGSSQAGVRSSGGTRPVIVDEYGDWDYGGASSTSRQAREAGDLAMLRQANNVEDGMNKNMALSWFSAGAYWDYADYGGFTSYGVTRCGFVDMYRLPKFAYYFQQSQRDPQVLLADVDSGPMVYIANHWTATSPTTVRVYSNCEQISLFLNQALVATQAPDPGTAILHPPFNFEVGAFTEGTLRADCLMAGVKVASTSRTTPGAASAIQLRPEAPTLLADGSDSRLVFIDVVDDNGSVVPTDTSAVTLGVAGAGSLVGPSTVVMKGGQLATWVRGTRSAGMVHLTATSPGLLEAQADMTSQAVPNLPLVPADR